MGGVDSVLAAQETRQSLRLEKAAAFSARKQEEAAASHLWRSSSPRRRPAPTLQLLSQMKNTEQLEERVLRSGRKRATKNIVSPALAATLDRTKLTDRSATYVLTEAARCLGQNVEELNINRSSIRRQRLKHRAAMASKIREEFRSGTPLVVHWDGKLVMDLTTKEHVDRLPIIISGLEAPNCSPSPSWAVARERAWRQRWFGPGDRGSRGSGSRDVLRHHGIQHRPQKRGPVFLTNRNGKALRISPVVTISWSWWYMRCSSVFLGGSSSPEHCSSNASKPHGRASTERTSARESWWRKWRLFLEDVKDEALRWTLQVLQEREDLRDDYRELVKLVIIFLGGALPVEFEFLAPGEMHQARWMSKFPLLLQVFGCSGASSA
ncbi:hypothetical protein GWK47_014547 [Chionoecetes opilio]|uniref:Uncharacterized protein n=1 Tax=Chionoecetes opilio TaxID=41210 RepID=A0A8J5C0F0_CHIOP|nr:hypothetical protein GWK47_014547 [Chionoecetes opilio]